MDPVKLFETGAAFVAILGGCLAGIRYFIRAEFNGLKDKLDARYMTRELANERHTELTGRIERLEEATRR